MTRKQLVKDYLTFTRRERIGLLVLTVVTLTIIFVPDIVAHRNVNRVGVDTAWMSAIRSLQKKDSEDHVTATTGRRQNVDNYYSRIDKDPISSRSSTLFEFDPNTLPENKWNELGINSKTIRTIKNFLGKGGHFYNAEDLKKIYGLHPNDYFRLEPFVKIVSSRAENRAEVYSKTNNDLKHTAPGTIDINTADTTAFIGLPGIGSKLAARIVSFREKLGGFYSLEQVGETYGLPDSTFQKIKQNLKLFNTSIKKININTATVDELKTHPYIKYTVANPVVSYRNEHGPFSKLEDLKKVMAVTEEVYLRIVPYLSLQ